jgi:hypothetical protein
MKKSVLIILIVCSFISAKSQAVLEHQYSNIKDLLGPFYTSNSGYVYAVISIDSKTVDLYDLQHNYMKTITPVLTADEVIWVRNVSDNLFNFDDKIELLVLIDGGNWNGPYKSIIINDENQIIQTFNDEWAMNIFEIAGTFRLINEGTSPGNVRKVYVLPGTTILDVQEIAASDKLSVFPNPTTGEITIKYPAGAKEISIYNASGSEVVRRNLSGTGTDKLNVSLPAGNYIYRLTSGSASTGSGKITIK